MKEAGNFSLVADQGPPTRKTQAYLQNTFKETMPGWLIDLSKGLSHMTQLADALY